MQPITVLVAFAAVGGSIPVSLSSLINRLTADDTTKLHANNNATATSNNSEIARRDCESKTSDQVCDTVAGLFNQGSEVNGTHVDTWEARENQDKGYSWDGPVYDGEKGFFPNEEYFDNDPDKPDGRSINPPGGAEYPH